MNMTLSLQLLIAIIFSQQQDHQGGFAYAFAPVYLAARAQSHADTDTVLQSRSSITDNDDEEWRAFRARLVQNGLPTLESTSLSDDDDGSKSRTSTESDSDSINSPLQYAHITTPLVEVGSILISIPTTDLCQAIDQQYWHRSIVLITQVADNTVTGSVESRVPDEQLANGDKRGRWSYRGLLLNRCTNLVLLNDLDENDTKTQLAEHTVDEINNWRIQRGGDLLGLDSTLGTDYVCLHHHLGSNINDDAKEVAAVSTKLVGNLCGMTIADAKQLCNKYPTKYQPSDFVTFGGFCSWRPGQLEREMGDSRNEWLVLSVDGKSIWDELQSHRRETSDILLKNKGHVSDDNGIVVANKLLEVGTNMWRKYLHKINISEAKATNRLPAGQLTFYDQMLKVWAEDYMNIKTNSKNGDNISFSPDISDVLNNDSSHQIGPGTVVRAKCPPTNDMLLYDAEFVRCLILVLEDTSDCTVGIILNHPMSAAVECKEGDDTPLPLRYGGPIDVPSWKDGSYRDRNTQEKMPTTTKAEAGKEMSDEDNDTGDDIDMVGDDNMVDAEMFQDFLEYQKSGASFDDFILDGSIGTDFDDTYDGEEEDDDSSFIWIHRNSKLGLLGSRGGIQLGTSSLWRIKEDDALRAIQSGELSMEDTMVFAGVCLWEKGLNLGRCNGGLREQIDALGSLEVVRAWNLDNSEEDDDDTIKFVWEILSRRQKILTKDSLDSNINAAVEAWGCCSSGDVMGEYTSDKSGRSRIGLSDAALKAWLGVNLLEDPLGTLVEVKEDDQSLV